MKKLGLQFKKDRKKNIEAMEDAVEEAKVEEEVCKECSNWDLLNKDVDLSSLQHKDYPLEITLGSPVDPPNGRDTFGEGTGLSFMEITWENMRNACKFAFFQASKPTKSWDKKKTLCYKMADHVGKNKQAEAVAYDDPKGIGELLFPASWFGNDLSLKDYIDAIFTGQCFNPGLKQWNAVF